MRRLLVLVLSLCATALHAQGLRVRVVDAQSGQPIPLTLVTLLRGDEHLGEGMTRADGTRFFPADPTQRYRLLVVRPGMMSIVSHELTPGDSTVDVPVSASPYDFRAVRPVARECRLPAMAQTVVALREQALATLRLAELARGEGIEAIAIRRSVRSFDREGNQRDEQAVTDAALGSRLFRTAPTNELARRGFITADPVTGLPVYLGPDLSYFTSAEFAAGHCYGIVAGRDLTTGLIGLEFSPTDASTSQVGGVMWFDPETSLLRFIDFRLAGGRMPGPAASGRIAFERLPSGVWIARDWSLRAPVTTSGGQLLGFREEVGEALQVSATMLAVADSIANSRRPPGRIMGVVMDSLSRRPMAGAIVTVDSAGPSARVDSSGTFSIRSVPAGHHRLSIRHPLLDSIGAQPTPRIVRVGPDSTTHVVLGGPSLRTLKGEACADSLAVVAGRVRDVSSGAPVDDARVLLSWIEIVFKPNRPLVVNPVDIEVETDSAGRYAACVPARLEVTASAESGTIRTGRVDVRADDRGLAVLHLSLDRTATDTLVGSAVIRGIVEYQDRTPLAGATVMLSDPERSTITDVDGSFRIASIPGGTRVLDTRALGHAAVRTVVDAKNGDTTLTRIFLRRVTQLDAVVVRASAGAGSRALRELEERRLRGQGHRLTPVELLAFKNARMDAVARALPFTTVQWSRGLPRILLSGRAGRLCDPNVFVDGQRTPSDVLGDFPASEALAIEYFSRSTDVPLRYRSSNDCGAILLWTREGTRAGEEAAATRRRP